MTKARDLSKLLSTGNGKIAGSNLDVSFENITDTGTEGTKVATGTNAQRGSTTGQIRFNSTTSLAEYYDGTQFKSIDAPPTVSSISPADLESSNLPANITITGSNFSSGVTVVFIGNDGTETTSGTVTRDSATQITAQVPNTITSANEPYDIKVINSSSSLSSTLGDALNIDAAPVFSVASGSLGTLFNGNRAASNLTNLTATDDESDTVTFSITTGSAPTGLTLGSNGVWSGTADAVSSDTTSTFTVTASDGTNTSTRQYSITVNAPTYYAFTSTGTSTWTVPAALSGASVEILVVAGGGGGGRAGGGGAGGVLHHTGFTLSASSYSVTVGAGGEGQYGDVNEETRMRGDDSFFGSLQAFGGGGGGYSNSNGYIGGSGGGHGFNGTLNGGSSNQTSNNGGTGYGSAGASGNSGSRNAGGGGGGANGTGGNGSASTSFGGAGKLFSNFTDYGTNSSNGTSGTRGYFAGGGGGDGHDSTVSAGGVGGGGSSSGRNAPSSSQTGQANTGGGGGAAHYSSSGFDSNMNGGSGIVIVRA